MIATPPLKQEAKRGRKPKAMVSNQSMEHRLHDVLRKTKNTASMYISRKQHRDAKLQEYAKLQASYTSLNQSIDEIASITIEDAQLMNRDTADRCEMDLLEGMSIDEAYDALRITTGTAVSVVKQRRDIT